MTFDDVKDSVTAQTAIDRLESRLTALQEAGVEVAPLLSHLVHAHGLFAASDFTATASFCNDLLQLATRIAEGRETEQSSAQRAHILLSTYPLPSAASTERSARLAEDDDMPMGMNADSASKGPDSPPIEGSETTESMRSSEFITQRLETLQSDLAAMQTAGIHSIAGQMSDAIGQMTEHMMEGIERGFQRLAKQAERDHEALLEQVERLYAAPSSTAGDSDSEDQAMAEDTAVAAELTPELPPEEAVTALGEPANDRESSPDAGIEDETVAGDLEGVGDHGSTTEDALIDSTPVDPTASMTLTEEASTNLSESDIEALLSEAEALAEAADEETSVTMSIANNQAVPTEPEEPVEQQAMDIDPLADSSTHLSVTPEQETSPVSDEDSTITDEELLTALGSQEESIARMEDNDTEVADDEALSAEHYDVQEVAVLSDHSTEEPLPPADDDQDVAGEQAFAAADEAFEANKDEAVQAIAEIKDLLEEDDLTKLTSMVERTRSLIADVEAQVESLAGSNEAASDDLNEIPLAPKDDSGSLTRCMSELDHELESLLDELASTPVSNAESASASHERVDFDDMAGVASEPTSEELSAAQLDADVMPASEEEAVAQLMATIPEPEPGKAVETSPLLPSEVDSEQDTSPSALATGEQQVPAALPILPAPADPIAQHAVSDERIRGIIQEQLLEALDSPAVQQKIFAMLALEAAVNPSALSELTGVRAFLKAEMERMMKQQSADSILE